VLGKKVNRVQAWVRPALLTLRRTFVCGHLRRHRSAVVGAGRHQHRHGDAAGRRQRHLHRADQRRVGVERPLRRAGSSTRGWCVPAPPPPARSRWSARRGCRNYARPRRRRTSTGARWARAPATPLRPHHRGVGGGSGARSEGAVLVFPPRPRPVRGAPGKDLHLDPLRRRHPLRQQRAGPDLLHPGQAQPCGVPSSPRPSSRRGAQSPRARSSTAPRGSPPRGRSPTPRALRNLCTLQCDVPRPGTGIALSLPRGVKRLC